VKEALLRFNPGQLNVAPSEAELTGKGNGVFSTKGAYFSFQDNWQVQVVVRRENKFDAFTIFNFTVHNRAGSDLLNPTTQAAGGLLLIIGLVFVFLVYSLARKSLYVSISGSLLGAIILGLGLILLFQPQPASANLFNPVSPNSQSVTAGKILYSHYCVACHGITGKGDGPVGLTLNPRPADLTQHAIPGVHTDGELFQWITNGFPNSRMPPFKTSLSDTDRWNLVNFIRTLAPK
jgi:mono/diheme cytochrome c family protein